MAAAYRLRVRLPATLGIALLASAPGAVALELPGAISAEVARLEKRIPESEREGPLAKDIARALEDLSAVGRSLEEGRVLLALEQLLASYELLESAAFWAENREVGEEPSAFESLWQAVGREVEAGSNELDREALRSRPAFVRAQAETAWNRAIPHLHAARLHVKSGLLGGLFYLGSARSALSMARLCAALPATAAGAAPRFRPLGEVERELSRRAIQAYGTPGASTAHHREFIRLDSALKEARALLQDGRLYGAVYSLLEARFRLGVIERSSAPRVPFEGGGSRIEDPSRDHTIAGLFQERARALAESGDEGDRLRAAVLVEEVIPFYFTLVED